MVFDANTNWTIVIGATGAIVALEATRLWQLNNVTLSGTLNDRIS